MIKRIAIVANPRRSSGERRRIESLQQIAQAARCEVVTLRPHVKLRARTVSSGLHELAAGRVVPESLTWDAAALATTLDRIQPDVVIAETARSFHPELLGPWRLLIDFVDQLSLSYRQRARITRNGSRSASERAARTVGYSMLSECHRRFETRWGGRADGGFAAGLVCADRLGVEWLPNCITPFGPLGTAASAPPFDLVFFGSLSYPPNVEAVQWLGENPSVIANRSLLLAGRNPSREVVALAATNGWTVQANFTSPAELAASARLAIVPLQSASGLQNKVLEAASVGLPQVITPAAAAGLGAGEPFVVGETAEGFGAAVNHLLANDQAWNDARYAAWQHVHEVYTPSALASRFAALVTGP